MRINELKNISRIEEAERAVKLYGKLGHSLALSRCKSEEDAEDVWQEVLVALMKRKKPFRSDEHMKAWIIRAVDDRCKNVHRYNSRHPQAAYDPSFHDRQVLNGEEADYEELHRVVDSLPTELKDALRLYYRDGYSSKEIAKLQGIRESSVRARLHRARKMIAACLACIVAFSVAIGVSAYIPDPRMVEALEIDLSKDDEVQLKDLPIKALQGKDGGATVVTFQASLKWGLGGIDRVVYSINSKNARLYSPGVGNYFILNEGEQGSTDNAVCATNGLAGIVLNIEVEVPFTSEGESVESAARNILEGKTLTAIAYCEDGSSEVSSCRFVQ